MTVLITMQITMQITMLIKVVEIVEKNGQGGEATTKQEHADCRRGELANTALFATLPIYIACRSLLARKPVLPVRALQKR